MKFKPFISNTLPDGLQVDYLGEAFDKEIYQNDSSKKEKRRILITQNNVALSDPRLRPSSSSKPKPKSS